MIYELPFPSTMVNQDAGQIHAYLTQNDVGVESVTITSSSVIVEASSDPTAIMAAFEPEPTEREQLLTQLDAINLSTATTATLRQAVTLLKDLVKTS